MRKKVLIDPETEANIEWIDFKPQKKEKPEKRNLLITTDNFIPRWDGISRFLTEVIPRLKDHYYITVVCPDYGEVKLDDVEIVQIPIVKNSFGDYSPARFAYREVRQLVKNADLVFNQALGPIGVSSIFAAKFGRRPISSYIHSIEWELVPKAIAKPWLRAPLIAISKFFAKICYNMCTQLIVPSENISEMFSWQRIRTPKRVAHLGVDTKKFSPVKDKKQLRENLGLPKSAFIIGYHGRIAHEKNLLTLIRGFKRLKAKDKHLLIVGDGVPELRDKLKKHAHVTVTGSRNDPQRWLRAMDVYVQPSFTETTSLTVLEAMATGLPVISSKVGFIKYYIIDEQNGMFFDNTSGYDLSLKIKKLYEDKKLRKKIGDSAQKTIEKSFKWEKTAECVKDALAEI